MFDVKTARLNRGLSQREAAREIGVHAVSLRTLERGQAVRPATAKKVADFYGIKVVDLMPEATLR